MPLTGNPDDVYEAARTMLASRIQNIFTVKRFYIGRTVDLASRQKAHGCDTIIPIYQTDSDRNARHLEARLVEYFSRTQNWFRPSMSNIATDSRGSTSEGPQFVYLAIWRHKFP